MGEKIKFIEEMSMTLANLQKRAFDIGLPLTARGLNNAVNAAGWELAGNLSEASNALKRHTDLEP